MLFNTTPNGAFDPTAMPLDIMLAMYTYEYYTPPAAVARTVYAPRSAIISLLNGISWAESKYGTLGSGDDNKSHGYYHFHEDYSLRYYTIENWEYDSGYSTSAAVAYLGDAAVLHPDAGLMYAIPWSGMVVARRAWRFGVDDAVEDAKDPIAGRSNEVDAVRKSDGLAYLYIATSVVYALSVWLSMRTFSKGSVWRKIAIAANLYAAVWHMAAVLVGFYTRSKEV